MPSLTIHTNIHFGGMGVSSLMEDLTDLTAELLDKPKDFIMVRLEHKSQLRFAGHDDPAAFVELISLGLPDDAPARLTARYTEFLQEKLSIRPDRMYFYFPQVPRTHFGWNGKTFG